MLDFKRVIRNHYFYVIYFVLVFISLLSGFLLLCRSLVNDVAAVDTTVTVQSACGFNTSSHNYTATVVNGNFYPDIAMSTMNISCNDASGWAVYAVGYSSNQYGNTSMVAPPPLLVLSISQPAQPVAMSLTGGCA